MDIPIGYQSAEIGDIWKCIHDFVDKHDLTKEFLEHWAVEMMGFKSYEDAIKNIESAEDKQ